MPQTLFLAQEPTFVQTSKGYVCRTKEHWVEVIKDSDGYHLLFGDERGVYKELDNDDLDYLLEVAKNRASSDGMEVEVDITEKEKKTPFIFR